MKSKSNRFELLENIKCQWSNMHHHVVLLCGVDHCHVHWTWLILLQEGDQSILHFLNLSL